MLRRLIEQAFSGADPRSLHTHVGLWIDKMLVAEEPSSQVSGPHLRKIEKAPVPDGYPVAFATRRAMLEAAADRGECLLFEAKTTSRLVVGLGAKGVLEMGLTLDHTWGTPYIPGSALKGICAATAHGLVAGEGWHKPQGWPEAPPADPDKLTDYQMLFGTTANEGAVVFHDAWWDPTGATDLPILMDVMTVHHPEYYQLGTKEPTDYDEPVPVPFLSVKGSFLVAVEGPRAWCEAAKALLEKGLLELGAGAKTSSGYGRLTLTPIVSERERTRTARLGELQAQLRAYKPGTKDVGVRAMVKALEAGVGSAEISEALRQVDKGHRSGLVESVRAAVDEAGRAALDAAVALLSAKPAAAQAHPAKAAAVEEERRVRARYEVDPSNAKRYFIALEGEKKVLKGGAVEVEAELLAEMRASGAWVAVVVRREAGKVRIGRG